MKAITTKGQENRRRRSKYRTSPTLALRCLRCFFYNAIFCSPSLSPFPLLTLCPLSVSALSALSLSLSFFLVIWLAAFKCCVHCR